MNSYIIFNVVSDPWAFVSDTLASRGRVYSSDHAHACADAQRGAVFGDKEVAQTFEQKVVAQPEQAPRVGAGEVADRFVKRNDDGV